MNDAATGRGRRPETFVAHVLARAVINRWGTPAQREHYLPGIDTGDVWCQLYSEPGAGSDLASLATRARRDVDGDGWIVDGQKVWSSYAHVADYGLLLARTNPDVPKRKGVTFFVLDMRSPGIEVRPLRTMTGNTEFNEVFLNQVRVPEEAVLGEIDDGWRVAGSTLVSERGGLGRFRPAGGAEGLVELARRSGRWADPVLRDRLMSLCVRERVLRLTGRRYAGRGGASGSVTKLAGSVLRQDIADAALTCSGMSVQAWDSEQPAWVAELLEARSATIYGGTSEIQRNIIGDRILGLAQEDPLRETPWKQVPR